MEYTTQSQDNRYLSRRQYRRILMQERIENFLNNPDETEYPDNLYLDEAKWLEKRYSKQVSFIFPEGNLSKKSLHPCIVKKIEKND